MDSLPHHFTAALLKILADPHSSLHTGTQASNNQFREALGFLTWNTHRTGLLPKTLRIGVVLRLRPGHSESQCRWVQVLQIATSPRQDTSWPCCSESYVDEMRISRKNSSTPPTVNLEFPGCVEPGDLSLIFARLAPLGAPKIEPATRLPPGSFEAQQRQASSSTWNQLLKPRPEA